MDSEAKDKENALEGEEQKKQDGQNLKNEEQPSKDDHKDKSKDDIDKNDIKEGNEVNLVLHRMFTFLLGFTRS